MNKLPPIPIPLSLRMRQIRHRILPVAVFIAAVSAVVVLWNQELTPVSMQGEVFAQSEDITAPVTGHLEYLAVQPFQKVQAGDLIALIRPVRAEVADAALAVLQSEIDLTRMGALDPVLDQQRNLLSWQNLHSDWLNAKAELESLKVKRAYAEKEMNRYKILHENNHVSSSIYDQYYSIFDTLKSEENSTAELVRSLEESLQRSQTRDAGDNTSMQDMIKATSQWVELRQQQLEAESSPVPIYAPISGIVTGLLNQQGAWLGEGNIWMTIRSETPQYIIGYLRQSHRKPVHEGQEVHIMSRIHKGQTADSTILKIGAQFEPLPLVFIQSMLTNEERALPIMIHIPPNLPLKPGELVDIRLLN